MNNLSHWQKLATEAAERFARCHGIENLTADEADQFAELGRSDMYEMIGRPLGIKPAEYKAWKEGTSPFPNLDLDFMLNLASGKHLTDDFLRGVK